jgi:hypothetical protein
MTTTTNPSPEIATALAALAAAESATGNAKRLRARAAVEAARRRLIELRSRAITPAAGHNTSTARLDKLEERLAQAEASLKETP